MPGNARLTGGAAAMLLFLLALEGATIPFIGGLRGPHIFIGMLLIPPVALKLGSTGYRFARYYMGTDAYCRKGPPPRLMRALGPCVVVTTLALFGTGVGLLVAGPHADTLRFLHKASFIAWAGFMALHVLGHVLSVPKLVVPDWRRGAGREAQIAGSGLRIVVLSASLLAGAAVALVTFSLARPWLS